MDELCRNVAEQRGKRLHLHSLPREAAASGICGLWIATPSDDHIFYAEQTSRVHQEHIVLHELGHLLFEHNMLGQDFNDGIDALLPDLDVGRVQQLMGRANYSTRQEKEAEMLASMMRMSADRPYREQSQGVLATLESALGVRPSDVG
ncbi:hypothetical protein ACTWQF_07890 [Streptomyces sp. 8N114]|uniref:hypothetical protein n=1 Tax=Streptomyces sp. 8N114 TaxID=3457419 RepID=UPI003FD1005F